LPFCVGASGLKLKRVNKRGSAVAFHPILPKSRGEHDGQEK